MASARTIAKRMEERRTWTVTHLAKDGKWYKQPVTLAETRARAEREGVLGRIRVQGDKQKARMMRTAALNAELDERAARAEEWERCKRENRLILR